uniref:Homeobox domain-containing protein n=1 Tax=Globodera pallida TaxID=36090 RepID=A0A183CT10_GLOPA
FLRQRRYLTETETEAREHPQNTAFVE